MFLRAGIRLPVFRLFGDNDIVDIKPFKGQEKNMHPFDLF